MMVKVCVELLPSTSLPKATGDGVAWIAGAGAGFTVSVAVALVIVPAVLLTTTSNVVPLCAVVVAAVV